MAHRNLDPVVHPTAGDVLAAYLQARATDFLRSLRLHRESGSGAGGNPAPAEAAARLRRSSRRISGTLHTFRPLLDREWSDALRAELAWLSGTLAGEHAHGDRLQRLLAALARLSGKVPVPGPARTAHPPGCTAAPTVGGAGATGTAGTATGTRTVRTVAPPVAGPPLPPAAGAPGSLTLGAAKAGALLERQLTLARTRAHSAALQALGSARFHAVADSVAVLASEVPLTPAAAAPAAALTPLATEAEARLLDATGMLPLLTAGHPYNAEALAAEPSPQAQDAPWHQVRLLLRLHRYAHEVLGAPAGAEPELARLLRAGRALDQHRDASEAATAAATAARTPRIAPATAYALGVLHADQRHEVEAARYAFQRAWTREVTTG
ncbi:CHAD domain-containing protein [Streptomyces sp. NPDC127068]|uniref:CHAD domain-containing protein n=1 Tax=Streptomyces sp. NPDC127068 TaxID=3347127 RepID=UPI003660B4A1